MTQLVDIFLQPSKVFIAERERPTFLVPALVLIALTAAFTLAYFFRVDPGWYSDHVFDAAGMQVSAKQMAQAKASMPSPQVTGVIGSVGGALMLAIMFAVIGLYYWLASKVTGRELGYRHGLSLATWSSMPAALGAVIALVGAVTMSPQTALESLMLTHIDPLFVHIAAGEHGHRLAQSVDLLSLWTMFLAAVGWRVFTRSGWGQAILVAMLPYAVVYGVIALLPG